MKRIASVLATGVLSFLLAACISRSAGWLFEFNGDKKYALVVYDIYFISEDWPNYALYLFPYDPATGVINPKKRIKTGSGFISKHGNSGVEFYAGTADPGTYVAAFLFYQTQGKKTILCFPEQALLVPIEPGKIHYLGEMTFPLDHPEGVTYEKFEALSHDAAHVRGRLAKYPNVSGEIVIVPQVYVAFDPGTPTRENACIAGYAS
ncbi:MAG TPA: hypothetical protein VD713_00580 [Sphingomonadales bacterium]|nr:hypothetical protein [Sphingomonadales bacterium]